MTVHSDLSVQDFVDAVVRPWVELLNPNLDLSVHAGVQRARTNVLPSQAILLKTPHNIASIYVTQVRGQKYVTCNAQHLLKEFQVHIEVTSTYQVLFLGRHTILHIGEARYKLVPEWNDATNVWNFYATEM